ncbi:glutathione S-transferase family protein [Synechococcus lacustris]|uniref:glutathione S-transferase family protein n=1 Tax=Synechococcus lacustris TaxID=2116544 RepID=UPI0020CC4AD6|nr:glutathione S-transferase N-terminal domain-containing protein [Synechococcus lacustris]MCP9794352.1 glutathione S-transferase N-terminal domain-containing protein [Synechococcus lacustris L1F-Slac]MCP9812971.1 glutathione S-transferase N-terminal domain-containing protein [Synechococcus lacustris L1E-Slac]
MFSWEQLEALAPPEPNRSEGPANSQARLRPFGRPLAEIRVVLYRDHHAWCPYCQKVWLWLEEQQVPYQIKKVSMFCYGEKEAWFRQLVPSGMLPALSIDGQMITESDVILLALERSFGVLGGVNGRSIQDPEVLALRALERDLFRAWCTWLCYPGQETEGERLFEIQLQRLEAALEKEQGPFLFTHFSSADLAFVPYLERMNSSLLYYKGYELRKRWPAIDRWFTGLEQRSTYCGTRSDHHTHAHDLPPQMGGCYGNGSAAANYWAARIDAGPWHNLSDAGSPAPGSNPATEALRRVIKHRRTLLEHTPGLSDAALRSALTRLVTDDPCAPPPNSDLGLRNLRDRICVPRDMGIHAARLLRAALEQTAALAGSRLPAALPRRHRRDQNPAPFLVHS